MKNDGRVYVTHARWFDDASLTSRDIRLTKVFREPHEIEHGLTMQDWGWPALQAVFPIIELTVTK